MIRLTDSVELCDSSERVYTEEGYLIAPVVVARAGIQMYRGYELGDAEFLAKNNLDRNKTYNVFRPEEEVFKPEYLNALRGITLVNNDEIHKSGKEDSHVTAENWKKNAVGEVLEPGTKHNGDWVKTKMIARDLKTIKDIQSGKNQVSLGYSSELEFTPGVYKGVEYHAVQRNIKPNHLAIVKAARAGTKARIADSDLNEEEVTKMTTRTVLVDGIPVDSTEAGAVAIETLKQRLADSVKHADEMDAKAKSTEKDLADAKCADEAKTKRISELEKNMADAGEELKKLKGQVVSADEMDKKVADRAAVVEKGKKLADSVSYEGKSNDAYRKEVIKAVIADAGAKTLCDAITGGKDIDSLDESISIAAFNALFVNKSSKDSASNKTVLGDSFLKAETSTAAAATAGTQKDARLAHQQRLENAWKDNK